MRSAAVLTTIALAVARANDAQCAATPAAGGWGGSWTTWTFIADSPTEGTTCVWPLSVVDYALCTRWPFWRTSECVECLLQVWGYHILCNVKSAADLKAEAFAAFAAEATAAITDKIGNPTKATAYFKKVAGLEDVVIQAVEDPVTRTDGTLVLGFTFEAESADDLCTPDFKAGMRKAVQAISPELDFSAKKVEIKCTDAAGRLRRLVENNSVNVDVEISDDDGTSEDGASEEASDEKAVDTTTAAPDTTTTTTITTTTTTTTEPLPACQAGSASATCGNTLEQSSTKNCGSPSAASDLFTPCLNDNSEESTCCQALCADKDAQYAYEVGTANSNKLKCVPACGSYDGFDGATFTTCGDLVKEEAGFAVAALDAADCATAKTNQNQYLDVVCWTGAAPKYGTTCGEKFCPIDPN